MAVVVSMAFGSWSGLSYGYGQMVQFFYALSLIWSAEGLGLLEAILMNELGEGNALQGSAAWFGSQEWRKL